MKEMLWSGLQSAVRWMPERLRLAFLEQPLVVPLDYGDLEIAAHGPIEYYVRSKSAAKEPDMIDWIHSMPQHSALVDVGANVGTYSLMAASSPIRAKVLAVEPSATNYASLCRNIDLNGLGESIVPVAAKLGSYTGLGFFQYSSWEPGAALHGNDVNAKPAQQMLTYRLDELIDLLHFPQPTHIKIDVDGVEMSVLKGALHTIGYCQSVMIELGYSVADLQAVHMLKDKGLSFHSKRQCQPDGPYANYWNWRFDRK